MGLPQTRAWEGSENPCLPTDLAGRRKECQSTGGRSSVRSYKWCLPQNRGLRRRFWNPLSTYGLSCWAVWSNISTDDPDLYLVRYCACIFVRVWVYWDGSRCWAVLSNISADDPDLYCVFCQMQGGGGECELGGFNFILFLEFQQESHGEW